LIKEETSPFIIELPPYRLPSVKGVFIHIWERVWRFIKKAGTIILAFSIIVWFLTSFIYGVKYGSQQSYFGSLGQTTSPVLQPRGFGNWKPE
jgi:ferrous iron transport protein B